MPERPTPSASMYLTE